MNTHNIPTQDSAQNVEVYEDAAIKRSRIARNVAVGAALATGGGIAGAAVTDNLSGTSPALETDIDSDDIIEGATIADGPKVEETTEYVHVQQPAPASASPTAPAESTEPAEPEIAWDDSETLYVDGEKAMSMEKGKIDGHDFMLIDEDGDDIADYIAVDSNNNQQFDEDEIVRLSHYDNVRMGHETAHSSEHYLHTGGMFNDEGATADAGEIHNNFQDEKTGENYHGDYAENNNDYNPDAESGNYYAGLNEVEPSDTDIPINEADDLAYNEPFGDEGAEEMLI